MSRPMLQSHASQFKVETVLPELANRQIQQIEIELIDLRIISRLRRLLAQGSIRRVINYLEPDGRLRMAVDLLQFEVALGEQTAENLSLGEAQLQQDYFIFQKRPFFRNQAVLEQAFTLTVQYAESLKPEASPPVGEKLTLDRIFDRSRCQRTARFNVDFPFENIRLAGCTAGWVTDYPLQPPLVSGVIVGTVGYYSGPEYREWQFTQPVGFLIPELPEVPPAGNLIVQAAVRQTEWWIEGAKRLSGEVKIEFSWLLTQPQPVACLIGRDCDDPQKVVRIKTRRIIKEETVEFLKSIRLLSAQDRIGEPQVTVKTHRERFSAGGILVSGILSVEAFGANRSGIEEYCQWEVPWDELIGGVASETVDKPGEIVSRVRADLQRHRCAMGELELEILITCHYQLIQSEWLGVLRGMEGHCPVWAEVLNGSQTFEVSGETQFVLPGPHLAVHRIECGLTGLKLRAEPGWVRVEGRLDAAVYYSDEQRQQRMELFCRQLRESFPWEGMESGMEFDHAACLKYDTYTVSGPNILYHYLLEIQLESYRSQEIQVAPGAVFAHSGGVTPGEAQSVSGGAPTLNFRMETEIDLKQGVPKEIINYRCLINRFRWHDAGNAILVEGNLSNELEYWDNAGFWRRESVDQSFWRFLQYPGEGERTLLSQVTPEIRSWDCQPVKAWPWQKGSVKISLAFELTNGGVKEETDESLDAEPGGLCSDGRRRCDSVGANQRSSGRVGSEDGMERRGANRFERL
jgi:hypothetical protein